MHSEKCFYCEGLDADGTPFVYKMISYTGIAGGVGPTGSIKSKNKTVSIPRSRRAEKFHALASSIKILFFISLLVILFVGANFFNSIYLVLFFSIFFLSLGGAIVQLLYYFNKVRSKLFHSSNYPQIKDLEDKGYSRGSHVIIASTPLGTVVYLSRWIF